ncbi:transporter substrate-binding domain-containing protein [Pseudodesulfovibrio cashew]|uniref:Transporter substrate-binding domain-containing protein n=1 Tax=Pseudodesulfovibrio cashew TaxID=2678688 RepID=A0A6I6JK35_9BACT|nr:transporter substrate-binding domain-containing protein [Pseudodesulfovibrio cashew]QGY41350.1 transporter substrate-binding domain-containing protein [Pseudodesulfovibrio cashew]
MPKIFLIPTLLLLLATPVLAEDVVLLSNEYAPYVNVDQNHPGFLTELVVAAFKEVGVKAHVEFRPWRRCAMLVESGSYLGAFPYAISKEREKYAWFSNSIWSCRNVFFYLKKSFPDYDYTNLESMRSYLIGGTSGNYYEKVFHKVGLRVDYAPGEASGLWKLWDRRNDFFAEDELVGWSLIRRIFPEQRERFASTPTPWRINPQHLMISKKYPGSRKLLQRFNEGLKKIRTNGTFHMILSHYIDLDQPSNTIRFESK